MKAARHDAVRAVCVVASVVLAAGACSSGGGDGGGSASAESAPTAADRAKWVLPLDGYLRADGSDIVTDYAENLLVSGCMTKAGFDWSVPAIDVDSVHSATRTTSGARLFDEAVAKKYGYHEGAYLPAATQEAMARLNAEQLSASKQAAFDACLQEARQTLPLPDVTQLAPRLANAALVDAGNDAAVKAAATKWRECMVPQGVPDLPDLPDGGTGDGMPTASQRARFGLDAVAQTRPSADEIRAALADAECRDSSGFSDALYAAQWRGQQAALKKNADTLVRDRDAQVAYVKAAREVVAQKAGS